MADRTDNRPYKGQVAEREERYTSGFLDPKPPPPQNWSVFDSEIPMSSLAWWYLKIGIPALVFVAISAAICYCVVSFLMGLTLEGAAKQMEKEFSSSSFFKSNQRSR